MSNDKTGIPNSLINALKNREVVPFVGAGVSLAVKKKNKVGTNFDESLFPSWKGYIGILAKTLMDEGKPLEANLVEAFIKSAKPKYFEAMQHAFDELGKPLWFQILNEYFKKEESEAEENSLELPRLIWKLGSNVIFTTNIDRVLEWKSVNSASIYTLNTQKIELAELQRDKNPPPTIIYLHGMVGDKENIIFTRKQYDNFYKSKENEAKLKTLHSFLSEKSFVFIGFSLEDDYFVQELKNIYGTYGSGTKQFYTLIKKSDAGKLKELEFVTEVYFDDFGEPLLEVVRQMRSFVEETNNKKTAQVPKRKMTDEETAIHFNVPFPSKGEGFVGRVGKFDELWSTLNRNWRAVIGQAVNIKGIGGLGKTQLAVEYAHSHRNKYKNGVFWLTADENIDAQLIKIGEDLNWISQFDKGFDQAELVRNRFRKLSDCLIIFDNVNDEKDIKNYLPERYVHPHILITSRGRQQGYYPIILETLSHIEARKLLTQIAEREPENENEKAALENILTELDGLPLALELVGGYLLRRQNISFQDYYKYLQNEPLERLEKRFLDESFTQHDKSIIRTLQVSEKLLNEVRFLKEILDILAWSGKSSMGLPLLQTLVGTKDCFAFQDSIGMALELHFIKQEEGTKRYSIHRLLARVRRFENPLAERKEWHEKIVRNIENWFIPKAYDFNDLAEFEAEIAHLHEWQELTFNILPKEAVLLTALRANPLNQRGNFQEANKWLETAYQIYLKEGIEDRQLLGYLFNFLGINYKHLGNTKKAMEYHQQELEINQELFGEKHPNVAASLNNLSSIYIDLGKFQKALKLQRQALEINQELFGEKSSSVAASLANLGYTYGELNEHQKALKLQQQALDMNRKLFGEKHPNVAISLNNLSSTYSDLGNYQEALKLQQQALDMNQELFGEKHPNVANSLNNLAENYCKLGNYKKTLELHKQALKMYQELFGEKHVCIATSLNNLGETYGIQKNYTKALEYLDKSFIMRREILGNQHPNTILTCKNLIMALQMVGKIERAGRLAAEFLSYVPHNHPKRSFFERHGRVYRKAKEIRKKVTDKN